MTTKAQAAQARQEIAEAIKDINGIRSRLEDLSDLADEFGLFDEYTAVGEALDELQGGFQKMERE